MEKEKIKLQKNRESAKEEQMQLDNMLQQLGQYRQNCSIGEQNCTLNKYLFFDGIGLNYNLIISSLPKWYSCGEKPDK